MLDFWLPDGTVELVVYAPSIDFGANGYGNLVELASLQRHVADALGVPGRTLHMQIGRFRTPHLSPGEGEPQVPGQRRSGGIASAGAKARSPRIARRCSRREEGSL